MSDHSRHKLLVLVRMPDGCYEAWSDLKSTCRAHGWSYCAMLKRAFPAVTRDGCTVFRVSV